MLNDKLSGRPIESENTYERKYLPISVPLESSEEAASTLRGSMVRLSCYQIKDQYDRIKASVRHNTACSVMILVGNDVDAIASCRMLTAVLRDGNIAYTIRPVLNITQVEHIYHSLTSDIKVIIMLNCGATHDIPKLFDLEHGGDKTVYILDNHRPIHKGNIHKCVNNYNVVIFDPDVDYDGDSADKNDDDCSVYSEPDFSDDDSIEEDEEDGLSDDEDIDEDSDEELRSIKQSDDVDDAEVDEIDEVDDVDSANENEIESAKVVDTEGGDVEYDNDETRASNDDIVDRLTTAATDLLPIDDASENVVMQNEFEDNPNDLQAMEEEDRSHSRSLHGEVEEEVNTSKEDDEDDDDIRVVGRKRKGLDIMYDPLKKRKIELHQYYKYTGYTRPTAVVLFDYFTCYHKAGDFDQIWNAIVGLTDQYRKSRYSKEKYLEEVDVLKQQLSRDSSKNRYKSEINRNDENQESIETVWVTGCQTGNIKYKSDFELYLYRHWSLYDAMRHSPAVAMMLKTWKNDELLLPVLAQLGIPLQQCKQLYSFMSPVHRQQFKNEVLEMTKAEDDPEKSSPELVQLCKKLCKMLIGSTFLRYNSFKNEITADDIVLGTTALLEEMCRNESAGDSASNELAVNDPMDQHNVAISQMESFNNAYDCLGMRNEDILKKGIDNAVIVQKYIVLKAGLLLDPDLEGMISHYGYKYYFADISTSKSQHVSATGTGSVIKAVEKDHKDTIDGIYERPLVLYRLGQYVMNMKFNLKVSEGGWMLGVKSSRDKMDKWIMRIKPFFMFSYKRDRVMVIGISPLDYDGYRDEIYNKIAAVYELGALVMERFLQETKNFKRIFKQVCKSREYDFRYYDESFDSNVIEIEYKDLSDFRLALNEHLERIYKVVALSVRNEYRS